MYATPPMRQLRSPRRVFLNVQLTSRLAFRQVTGPLDLFDQHGRASAEIKSNPSELATNGPHRWIDPPTAFPDPYQRQDIVALVDNAAWKGSDVSIKAGLQRFQKLAPECSALYDADVLFDTPHAETAATRPLALGTPGKARTQTMQLYDEPEFSSVIGGL